MLWINELMMFEIYNDQDMHEVDNGPDDSQKSSSKVIS